MTGSRPTSSGAVGLELAVVDADGEAWEAGWGEPAPEGSETAGVSLLVALAAGRLAPRRARATRAFVANGAKGPVEVAEGAVMALTRAEPGAAWWAGTLEGDGGDQLEFLAQVVEPIETAVAFDPELAAGRRGRHSVVELDELVDDRDGSILDSTEIELDPDQPTMDTVLTAAPSRSEEDTGTRRWSVRIEGEDDLVPENNTVALDIEFVDRPLRVLYIEGYPRWEYRYLKNLLVREPSIESSVMLLSADRDFAQEGNTPLARLPRTAEEFAAFDLIILGDIPSGFLTDSRQELIQEQVARRGGGLVMIAGPRSMPSSWSGTPLADLLPFTGSLELDRRDGPVLARPTDVATRLGVLRLVLGEDYGWPEALSDASYGWSQLQWVQRIDPERLKPTAEILAEVRPADGDQADVTPLVLGMRYGAGQVLYVATDEIWRWRYGRGELLPEQFWVQLLRLLGREAVQGDQPVRLVVEPRQAVIGRPVRITVDLLDAVSGLLPPDSVVVEAFDGDGVLVGTVELPASGEASWAGTWIPPEVGPVEFRIAQPGLSALAGGIIATIEVARPDDELRDADADHDFLATLSKETGGLVHLPDETPGLLDRVHEQLPNRAIVTERPLRERIWTSPLFFTLFLLLATLEWVGRRLTRLD